MSNAKRRILMAIAAVLACVLMAAVGYAATLIFLEVKDNYFKTGAIEINLNDGAAVIQPEEFLFEPGATIRKEFFLENTAASSDAVYYRFFVQEVEGVLADHLQVTIRDKQTNALLAAGSLTDFESKTYMKEAGGPLAVGERQYFEIYFHMPDETGNAAKDKDLSFSLGAVAVQSRNNEFKEFE